MLEYELKGMNIADVFGLSVAEAAEIYMTAAHDEVDRRRGPGWGGVVTTANDYAKWVAHLLSGWPVPAKAGTDGAVLRAMRRSYRTQRFLGILDKVRAVMPEAAITTDIIVGFPGETEEDFQATLDVVMGTGVDEAVKSYVAGLEGVVGADAVKSGN